MKIGIVYDRSCDYDLNAEQVDYLDFCYLSEAENAKYYLELSGYSVDIIGNPVNFAKNITHYKKSYQIIYNIAEGFKSRNREGLIPSICELYEIPYTGSDAFGNSLTLHKMQTKLLASAMNIPTPPYIIYDHVLSHEIPFQQISAFLQYPIVAKPNHEGSSMGVRKLNNDKEVLRYFGEFASLYNQEILFEKYVCGLEVSVCILGSEEDAYVFGVTQYLDDNNENIDFLSPEIKQRTKYNLCIPQLPSKEIEDICRYSLALHKSLHLKDISRIDWKIDYNTHTPYFLEITPLPILSVGTEFEWICKQKGISYSFVFDSIIRSCRKRYDI